MRDWKMIISATVLIIAMVSQIILSFFLYNKDGLQVLRYIGWIVWAFSVVFGWLPIFTFRSKGKVPKGKSYIRTTVLVDSGIYAIVRHPQFLAGIMFSLALILIVQHWLITILGIVAIVIFYKDIIEADKSGVEKFGDDYIRYMQRVPRMNFFAGIICLIRYRKSEEK